MANGLLVLPEFSCIMEGKIVVSWHDMIVSSHDTVVSCHDTVVSSCAVIAEYVKGGIQICMPTVSYIYSFVGSSFVLRSSSVVNSIILRCELDLPPLTKRRHNGGITKV